MAHSLASVDGSLSLLPELAPWLCGSETSQEDLSATGRDIDDSGDSQALNLQQPNEARHGAKNQYVAVLTFQTSTEAQK